MKTGLNKLKSCVDPIGNKPKCGRGKCFFNGIIFANGPGFGTLKQVVQSFKFLDGSIRMVGKCRFNCRQVFIRWDLLVERAINGKNRDLKSLGVKCPLWVKSRRFSGRISFWCMSRDPLLLFLRSKSTGICGILLWLEGRISFQNFTYTLQFRHYCWRCSWRLRQRRR